MNERDKEAQIKYGITLKDGKYFYKDFSFSSRDSAINFAKLKQGHSTRQDDSGEGAREETKLNTSNSKPKNPISSLYNGECGLGKTCWLYGIIAPAVVVIAFILLEPTNAFALQASALAAIAYAIFINIAIWRASKKETASVFWGRVARLMVILSILLPFAGILAALIIPAMQSKHELQAPYLQDDALNGAVDEPGSRLSPQPKTESTKSKSLERDEKIYNEKVNSTIKSIYYEYPVLEAGGAYEDPLAVAAFTKRYQGFIESGYSEVLALNKAAEMVGPPYMDRLLDKIQQQQEAEARRTQKPAEQKPLESARGVFPPPPIDECIYKQTMTDEERAACGLVR